MRKPRALVLKVAALQVGRREVPQVVQPAELQAAQPVERQAVQPVGALQVGHDFVGAIREQPHRNPPLMGALDARLRRDAKTIASRDP